MNWARTRYGLPVIVYNWVIGSIGLCVLTYFTLFPPFPHPPMPFWAFALFFFMHVIASFLHFQYVRLNVVITFEAAFTTAMLLVFGIIPAVWVSMAGITFGSLKRVLHRRFVLHKDIPLSYDIGIIVFNCGMVGIMWLLSSWAYITILRGDIPLYHLAVGDIIAILLMFLCLSAINHIILTWSAYFQGFEVKHFLTKGVLPAFLTELATIPFGVVMALSYNRMGPLAFFFLAATLLLSNAVLRNLSIIRYDQEEKLRQLRNLVQISQDVLSLRQEKAVIGLLCEQVGKLMETSSLFIAQIRPDGQGFTCAGGELRADSVLMKLTENVADSRQPIFFSSGRKDGPPEFADRLVSEGIRSAVIVPLLAGEKLYGLIGVWSNEFLTYKQEDVQLLVMVANEAALALENTKLYGALTDQVSELERLNKELRQLDKLKSEFLANVSHELRTPLTSIKGYVEYIKKEKLGPITPLQSEGLTVAQRNILRLQRLINDLLDYTRLEFKKAPLVISASSLEDMWTEIYDEYAEAIAKNRQTLHVSISPDLPLLYVDRQKYLQVLHNLISNAIKFTPEEGSIWLEARPSHYHLRYYHREIYQDHCAVESLMPVEISVRDSGIGIPQEALPRIFERFYQVDSSNTRKYGGTGLGLAIVKSVVDAHGNAIDVKSVVGEGTVFSLILPGIQQTQTQGAMKSTPIDSAVQPKYLT